MSRMRSPASLSFVVVGLILSLNRHEVNGPPPGSPAK